MIIKLGRARHSKGLKIISQSQMQRLDLTLSQVKSFITQEHHLCNVPLVRNSHLKPSKHNTNISWNTESTAEQCIPINHYYNQWEREHEYLWTVVYGTR